MLVLSRQRDENVLILLPEGYVVPKGGVTVKVTVVDIRSEKVRLGFEGPKVIPIHREEVYEAILKEGGSL